MFIHYGMSIMDSLIVGWVGLVFHCGLCTDGAVQLHLLKVIMGLSEELLHLKEKRASLLVFSF